MAKSTKTVVFIDPNVADWQDLVNGVEPGSLVFILDPQRDGISQITNKLATLTDIDSVQIISHGGEGSLSLGSSVLNSANLNGYSSQLQQWGKSLTATGDILLYGCDVAQGFVGKAFVQHISQLTGADVAASDNLTGSAALAGDWVLEYATGLIEAPLALQVQAMEAYTSVLPTWIDAKNIADVASQIAKMTDVTKHLAGFAHELGFGWCGGTNSQYVGEGFDIINNGTASDPRYILKARYNPNDPYASGYWSDKRLNITLSNFKISIDPTSLSYSQPRITNLTPLFTQVGSTTNTSDTATAQLQQSNSYSVIETTQHTTTYKFTQGIKTVVDVSIPFLVDQKTEISFSAEQGWSDSKTDTTTTVNGYSNTVPVAPRTQGTITAVTARTQSDVDYTATAKVSFDVSYYGFLRWSGNAREDFPRGRPFVTVNLSTDNLGGISFADLSNVRDNTGNRYDPDKFNTGLSVAAQNFFKDEIAATLKGTFTKIGGTQTNYIVITDPLDATVTPVLEDTINPQGFSLNTLFKKSINSVSVLSNPNNTAQGNWQFQNAGNWQNISTAQSLSGNNLVRFLPIANYNGTPDRLKVNFGFIDRWIGTSITGVNDAPVLTSGQINNINITGNTNLTSLGLTGLSYSPGGGSDEATQTLTYIVTATPNSSVGSIVLADGTTAVTTNTAYTLQQLQGMQFKRAGNSGGTDNFAFTVKDSGGTANGGVDTLNQSLTITVVEVVSPTITLAVSPSSVTEDGTANLIYTFTRTGATTNALTINYNVAGTATFNNDYTQIGAASFTATTGTITFAAGSSTKTLTIDPTADTTVETDETVALTLATGTGYTVGTTTAVTGTITNDDIASPSITLAVSPSSVTEDGTANLIYTFTRTGATTNALTVNYGVAGTATFNNDYTQIGAAGFTATTGTITFAAGSSTKTLTIDPTADTTVESNETVAVTLATGTGYTVGTTTAVTGTITNDDTAGPLTLTGDATNNNLVGGSGNDTFLGLGGQDTLTGGLGADRFRFNSPIEGMDTITDFSKTQGDKIELFATGFNLLVWTDGVSNALAPSVFSMGTSANSWTNSIIYNNSNGIVYFDADALGSGSQVALAQLSPGLHLTNQDFIVSWV